MKNKLDIDEYVLQAASGRRPHISVFGRDYDTPDGTCIRDCIHLSGLADAHWLAFDKLMQSVDSAAYNLANGNGFSVQQVIDTAASVTGPPIPVVDAPRRRPCPAGGRQHRGPSSAELAGRPLRPRNHNRRRLALGDDRMRQAVIRTKDATEHDFCWEAAGRVWN